MDDENESNGNLAALIKFFRDESKLDLLREGLFYCNTPEKYRLDGSEGVGDPNESCMLSYRRHRGDRPITLEVDGMRIEGINALTAHTNGVKDKWLHCWYALRIPKNEDELRALYDSLSRMREEFGLNYACVVGDRVEALVGRLKKHTELDIMHGAIQYSDVKTAWSVACKALRYSYQREFRFAIGSCGHEETQPLKIKVEEGLSDIIEKNPPFRITDEESGEIWLELTKDHLVGPQT